MRKSAFAGAAALIMAVVGGALAWGMSRPAFDHVAIDVSTAATPPIPATQDASAAWTGDEYIIWGGGTGDKVNGEVHDEGAAYDPQTDTWRTLAPAPLEARERHAAVWTGDEMIVWGGTRRHHGVGDLLDGARYDPAADSWTPMTPAPAGTDRSGGQAVVVDGHVLIGGGYGPTSDEETIVLIYDLADDRWDSAPASGQVLQLLPVGDQVALLTMTPPVVDGQTSELRLEMLEPPTAEISLEAKVDLEREPNSAGLLEHHGQLTLLVEPYESETQLFHVPDKDHVVHLDADESVEVSPPVDLFAEPYPQPVLIDDSRRFLVDHPTGSVRGIDLATGELARGDYLGAAACLANATYAVHGTQIFVWGARDCNAEEGRVSGTLLLNAAWQEPGS